MKDLVDIVFYVIEKGFDLKELTLAIHAECQKRGMVVPAVFEAPGEWSKRFGSFAAKNRVPQEYQAFDDAVGLAAKFFNPALKNTDGGAIWDSRKRDWIPADGSDQL